MDEIESSGTEVELSSECCAKCEENILSVHGRLQDLFQREKAEEVGWDEEEFQKLGLTHRLVRPGTCTFQEFILEQDTGVFPPPWVTIKGKAVLQGVLPKPQEDKTGKVTLDAETGKKAAPDQEREEEENGKGRGSKATIELSSDSFTVFWNSLCRNSEDSVRQTWIAENPAEIKKIYDRHNGDLILTKKDLESAFQQELVRQKDAELAQLMHARESNSKRVRKQTQLFMTDGTQTTEPCEDEPVVNALGTSYFAHRSLNLYTQSKKRKRSDLILRDPYAGMTEAELESHIKEVRQLVRQRLAVNFFYCELGTKDCKRGPNKTVCAFCQAQGQIDKLMRIRK